MGDIYPELSPASFVHNPDIVIEIDVNPSLNVSSMRCDWFPFSGGRMGYSGGEALMEARNYSARMTLSGNHIRVEFGQEIANRPNQEIILETALMLILRNMGYLPLHASGGSLRRNILFAAKTGSGKSTLAFNIHQSGGRVLSDDRVYICQDNSKIIAHSLDSRILLKEGDTAAGRNTLSYDPEERHPGSKIYSMMPEVLIFPAIEEVKEHRLREISGAEATMRLLPLTLPLTNNRELNMITGLSRQCRRFDLSISRGDLDPSNLIHILRDAC